MITDAQVDLAINSKVRLLTDYILKKHKCSQNKALHIVLSSYLYNHYLSVKSTKFYLDAITTLYFYLDIELSKGKQALIDEVMKSGY